MNNKETMKMIGLLSLPTIIEQFLQTMVQYADSAMVGRLGADASAAVGLTISLGWLVNAPLFAMGIGVLAFISRAVGRGDLEGARKAAVQGVLLALGLGLAEGVVTVVLSPFIPGWLGADTGIRRDASAYFAIICAPMIFKALNIILASVLRATKDMKTPMVVNVFVNGLNVVLNFFLIFPLRQYQLGPTAISIWGAGLGIVGAALATAIAQCAGGIMMYIALRRNELLSLRKRKLTLDKKIMRQCIKVGFPVALERGGVCLGHVVFTSMVTGLGTIAFAAHSIALTAEQAFYIPGYGMQAAASTLTGNTLGEGDEKKLDRITRLTILMAVIIMTITGGLLFLFPAQVMSLFTKDTQVILQGTSALRIVALSEPVFAVVIILEGVFNGAGDTKTPFIISMITMWGLRLLTTYIGLTYFGFGLNGVWVCMVLDNVLRCLLLTGRFFHGGWKKGSF